MAYNWQNGEVITAEKLNQTGDGISFITSQDMGTPTVGELSTHEVTTGDGKLNVFLYDIKGFTMVAGLPDGDYIALTKRTLVYPSDQIEPSEQGENLALEEPTYMYETVFSGTTIYIAPTDTKFYRYREGK